MPPAERSHLDTLRLPLDRLPDPLPIPVVVAPFDAAVSPPGSKSIANRALLLAALAPGVSTLTNLPAGADDVRVMIHALRALGARIDVDPQPLDAPARPVSRPIARITGVGGRWLIQPGHTPRLHLAGAGTAVRFLTAAALLAPPGAAIEIDGDDRMRQRPIADLTDALALLGASVQSTGAPARLPLRIMPPRDLASLPARVAFTDPPSSQFTSALMLAACFLPRPLTIEVRGQLVSEPYVDMTWKLIQRALRRTPITSHTRGVLSIRIPVGLPSAFSLDIEPDASSAAVFVAAATLCPGARITLPGLPPDPESSLQGDVGFLRIARFMGAMIDHAGSGVSVRPPPVAIKPIRGDFNPIPDTAMNAAVLACFADGPSTLRGLRTLRLKESDRLAALQTELSRVGARIAIDADDGDQSLQITPPSTPLPAQRTPIVFQTYNDHRIAMALALIGLRRPGVSIANPACVAKSYPTFWRDLADTLQSPR